MSWYQGSYCHLDCYETCGKQWFQGVFRQLIWISGDAKEVHWVTVATLGSWINSILHGLSAQCLSSACWWRHDVLCARALLARYSTCSPYVSCIVAMPSSPLWRYYNDPGATCFNWISKLNSHPEWKKELKSTLLFAELLDICYTTVDWLHLSPQCVTWLLLNMGSRKELCFS